MLQRTFVYRIDAQDHILFVNEDWLSFAKENAAPELTREAVLHQPLWGFVTNRDTRHLYEIILERVRAERLSISIPYRCDSPSIRRYMEMEISALPGGLVEFNSRIIKEEARTPVAALDRAAAQSEEYLTMCSWCKRAQLPGNTWVEVEEAITHLKLFEAPSPPQITHGICPQCKVVSLEAVQ